MHEQRRGGGGGSLPSQLALGLRYRLAGPVHACAAGFVVALVVTRLGASPGWWKAQAQAATERQQRILLSTRGKGPGVRSTHIITQAPHLPPPPPVPHGPRFPRQFDFESY